MVIFLIKFIIGAEVMPQLLRGIRSVLPVQSALLAVFFFAILSSLFTQVISKALDDSEFAEFEEFDDEEFERSPKTESAGKVPLGGGETPQSAKLKTESDSGGEAPKPRAPQHQEDDTEEGVVEVNELKSYAVFLVSSL